MATQFCDKCGSPLGFTLDGETLKSLVGIDSLGNEEGMQTYLSRLPDTQWEEAAKVLSRSLYNASKPRIR